MGERQRIMEEKQEAFKRHLEMLLQLEMDADREIEELKEMFEHQLAQEKDEKVRLRGQAGIHRKHHEDLKRQMTTKEKDLTDKMELNKRKQGRSTRCSRTRSRTRRRSASATRPSL